MTKVLIRKASYEAGSLRSVIREILESRGADWISPGARVVIKPNMLTAAEPDLAIVTHPLVIRTVAEYLLERGAQVQVSDSPPLGVFHKQVRQCGYAAALDGMDVELKPFVDSNHIDVGEPFGTIEIARDAIEADLVINLAKLKSHAQMYMTLGVKNMFGTVVGLRKPQWHMRSGVDRAMFAKLLVRIHQAVAPAFTIVDGILALEGQGPGKSGRPRELGLLVGGVDAHAVDKTVCTLLGLDPNELLTYRVARELNLFDGDVHVNGDIHIVDDFKFPELHTLSLGPDSLNRFMRRYVIQKPAVDKQRCRLCGECWQICPAQVISHNDKSIRFDYQGCIRCYCCLEVCPHGAIQAREPLLGKLRRRLIKEKPPQELKKTQAQGYS
jgi:uncharacterized protein (DUF362 family)/NAD-dependent dihydropyrimidine dehydrogenase PreA subunit